MASGFQAGLDTGMNFVGRLKEWMAGSGVDLLTNLLVSAVILLVGWVVIRLVDKALRKAMARANRKVLLVNFIVSVVTKVGWAILLVTILSRLGVDVTPLIAGLGVTGFILGFAFQESLGNLASGLMIAVNEPFKVGDVVDAAGHTGSVLEVNMMATVMLTPDNKRIVLPNKGVWGGPIVNYSAMDTRRVDLQVGIAYGEDVEKAVSVIRDAVRRVPGVLATPEPAVAVAGLDASQVTINVRPWAKNADYWSVRSATLQTVKEELDRVGIEIPFPQVVVHQSVKK
ncbi:MAG: mechanosensitive ion channel family protein [Kiritimatiellia bacterium]